MPDYLQRESNKITLANFYEAHKLGKYNYSPPYQRRSIWTDEKKSFLIDSILKNYPMPPIFLHQKIDDVTGNTVYDVIDGKQRLMAILDFIDGKIPSIEEYDGDGVESPVAGKFFFELDGKDLAVYKSRFWRYVIPVEYVDTGDQEVIDSIFDRLNRNGEPLSGQELRNANYYGTPLLNFLEKLSKMPFWADKLNTVDRTRMEDVEFLSELIFLILEGSELSSDQSLLDAYYEKYANLSDEKIEKLYRDFCDLTKYMEGLQLDYNGLGIRGVSHLYGIFAFCHKVINEYHVDYSREYINNFYLLWKKKKYLVQEVMYYKDSMSSSTKSSTQRKRRSAALVEFCNLAKIYDPDGYY